MSEDVRIAIFISYSGQGGVERIINNLAQGFLDAGYQVDMVIARAGGDHIDRIPLGVRQIKLGTDHTLTALPGLIRYLRRVEPDALLAVKDRAIRVAILARWLSGKRIRITGRIGTTVSAAIKGKGRIRKWVWYTGMRFFYKHADKIVVVSEGVSTDVCNITGLPRSRIPAVKNPVITRQMFMLANEALEHRWLNDPDIKVIVGIGRLTRQKDFPTLIKAFAQVRNHMECRLVILGEGRDRQRLESLVQELGLTEEVQLAGFVPNPYPWLSKSSLYVLSSLWEGSPNALTEALALGIPVVSTDCRSGPREILQDGRYGNLVPVGKENELAQAMIRTLNNPKSSDTLRQAVKEYTVHESVKEYLKALGLGNSSRGS